MSESMTRRTFLVLSSMAGTSSVFVSCAPIFGQLRKLQVAIAFDSSTQIEDLLPFIDSPATEIVAVVGPKAASLLARCSIACSGFRCVNPLRDTKELNKVNNFDALLWLCKSKSDPALIQAISSGKHVMLASPISPLTKSDLGNLPSRQIIQVLPSRAPVNMGITIPASESVRRVRIIRQPPRSGAFTISNEYLQENIHDELMVAQTLFDGTILIPKDVAVCNAPRGPVWSARFRVSGTEENCCEAHASMLAGGYHAGNRMIVQTARRSIDFPIVPRPADVSRAYFAEFLRAIRSVDRASLLGSIDEALAVAGLISTSTSIMTGAA